MESMKLIVGLGNPGSEYADTRHNTGFKVIDSVAKKLEIEIGKRKFNARFGMGEFAGKKLILLKPWQFMNCSGQSVADAIGFYKLAIGDLLVVSDDLALEPGRIRLRPSGSAGGHNGLADIIEKLGTSDFSRCRVGIGSYKEGSFNQVEYVLTRPTKEQAPLLAEAIEKARDMVLCWVKYGTETAMNRFNKA
jgi:peptidyl-tRNA hydrolase, PTH1 family